MSDHQSQDACRDEVVVLPCPSGHTGYRTTNNNIYGAWWIMCTECSWRTAGDTEAAAIAAWNARLSPAVEVERLLDQALDALDSIAGDRTPKFFPETSYDCARREAAEIRKKLAALQSEQRDMAPAAHGDMVMVPAELRLLHEQTEKLTFGPGWMDAKVRFDAACGRFIKKLLTASPTPQQQPTDGKVERVISRVFGEDLPVGKPVVNRDIWAAAKRAAEALASLGSPAQPQAVLWCGSEGAEHRERMKACRARRKLYPPESPDDDCDRDGSCSECEYDMAVALRCPGPTCRKDGCPHAQPQAEREREAQDAIARIGEPPAGLKYAPSRAARPFRDAREEGR